MPGRGVVTLVRHCATCLAWWRFEESLGWRAWMRRLWWHFPPGRGCLVSCPRGPEDSLGHMVTTLPCGSDCGRRDDADAGRRKRRRTKKGEVMEEEGEGAGACTAMPWHVFFSFSNQALSFFLSFISSSFFFFPFLSFLSSPPVVMQSSLSTPAPRPFYPTHICLLKCRRSSAWWLVTALSARPAC